MKKYSIIGLFLILFMSPSANGEHFVHDGNWWRSMGHIAKGYFLQGFETGISASSSDSEYTGLTNEHFSKAMDGLDLFYKDAPNRGIRIHVAIYIVLKKINGASIETITKLTELARNNPTNIPEIRK